RASAAGVSAARPDRPRNLGGIPPFLPGLRLGECGEMLLGAAATIGFPVLNAIEPRGSLRTRRAIEYGPHPRQKLDVYAPSKADGAALAVFLYGGAWRMGERAHYGFV